MGGKDVAHGVWVEACQFAVERESVRHISLIFCEKGKEGGWQYDFTGAGSLQNRSHHNRRLFAATDRSTWSPRLACPRRASLSSFKRTAPFLGDLYVRERSIPPRYADFWSSSLMISTLIQFSSVRPSSQPVSRLSARSSLKLKSVAVLLFLSLLLLDSVCVPLM